VNRANLPPENLVNSAYPTAVQHDLITQILGDYELGDVREIEQFSSYHSIQYRFLHYDGTADTSLEDERLFRGFALAENFETSRGDALFVYFEFFDIVWLMVDISEGETTGSRNYAVFEMT